MPLSGREKATILLSMIGADASSKILRHLPDEMADMLVAGVDRLPTPSANAVGEVLQEFTDFVSFSGTRIKNEIEPMPLKNEPEKADAFEKEAVEPAALPPTPPKPSSPLEKLEYADARSFASLLLYERTQMAAFVLTCLSERKREEILVQLPGQRQEIEIWIKQLSENKFTGAFKKSLVEHFAEKIS